MYYYNVKKHTDLGKVNIVTHVLHLLSFIILMLNFVSMINMKD